MLTDSPESLYKLSLSIKTASVNQRLLPPDMVYWYKTSFSFSVNASVGFAEIMTSYFFNLSKVDCGFVVTESNVN
jgi:hypothetical protein